MLNFLSKGDKAKDKAQNQSNEPVQSPAEIVQEKLLGGHEVRPFPDSVSRLLTAIKDPNAAAEVFADIIVSDVALSSRVLKMVNSSMYGLNREVESIQHAVTILGQTPLRNLALTYAGSSIISSNKTRQQCEELWDHSLGCATVAKLLAKTKSGIKPDEAFLAGIFHDIGKLFFLDTISEQYTELFSSNVGTDLLSQETELCGMDHAEAGLRLTVAWPLSDDIKGVIRYHHDPNSDSVESDLTSLIHTADGIARLFGIGSPVANHLSGVDASDILFGMSEDTLQELVDNAHELYDEAKQAFSK